MKAVRNVDGHAAVVDVDGPPGTGELLDMRSMSVCSSDLMYIEFGTQAILGHELAGIREDGTPVVVEAMYGCLTCEWCEQGKYNLCPSMTERALGVTTDGGMAEQYRAPAERLIPVPDGLDVRDASLVEPASVSWHALGLGGVGAGTRVAVVGGGGLGLLAAAGALHRGADDVDLEARYPHQAEAGERIGAHIGTSGSYDVVIEAAGSPASLARAAELVAGRGKVVVMGVFHDKVEIPWWPLFHNEASLIPSLAYCEEDGSKEMEAAAAMLAADPEITRALITHRFPLEDADEAFRVAADKTSGAIRVMIEP